MDSKKRTISRIGMVAKGTVYLLIGGLTALSAFGYGGKESGSKGAISYLADQPFGKVMLIVLGAGLLAYVFYRMYQTFGDHDAYENGKKGYAKRVAYFISGCIYGTLAYFSLRTAFARDTNDLFGGGDNDYSEVVLIVVGIGMAIKAVYDLYRAYSLKFREDIEEMELSKKERKLLVNSGRVGHGARGIVLALMAYITLRSAFSSGSQMGKQTDAFHFIKNEFGTMVLGLIALGLVAYGIFMLIKAKHPSAEFQN